MVKVSESCILSISQGQPIEQIKQVCLTPAAMRPRKRSEYNLHMASCMKESKGSSKPVTERFKECVRRWKEKKKY